MPSKVIRTYLATIEKSVDNELVTNTIVALKKYEDNTFELIISQNNIISKVQQCSSRTKAENQFYSEQIKHFGKIVQKLDEE